MMFSRMNVGSSVTPAPGEHGDGGARGRDVPENPRELPLGAGRTPVAGDNPPAMDVRPRKAKQVPTDADRTLKAADQPWMEPAVTEKLESIMTSLRQHMERHGIAVLKSGDIVKERVIAEGGYGRVIMGTLKSDGSRVVIKEKLESHYDICYDKMFAKETKLLSTIKHPNIVSLLAVCIEPTSFSPIMELMEFNLEHPNIRGLSNGHNLAELLRILDRAALIEEIGVKRGMFRTAALDVVTGLAFLHHKDICHRDMKPSNILVTNTGDFFTFKLTDFGESRSPDIQTKSVPQENTDRVRRGTSLFYSPEQILKSLKKADIADFKRIDVWSCGMVIFCLLSPDFVSPWDMELRNQPNEDKVLKESEDKVLKESEDKVLKESEDELLKESEDKVLKVLKERIGARQLPRGSDKYEHLADETGLGVIYKRCCHFDPESRPDIGVIRYELINLKFSRMNVGSSVTPAPGEHGDGGARARDVPENPRELPLGAGRTPVAGDNPRARDVRAKQVPINADRTLKAADQLWMEPAVTETETELASIITDLRQHMERAGIAVLKSGDITEERLLGKGGYAEVIKGTRNSDGSPVVIKHMLGAKENVRHVKLLAKEIKILSGIKHRNIVSLLAVCIDPTSFSPIMELMEFKLERPDIHRLSNGNNLADLLRILDREALVKVIGVNRGVFQQAALDVVTGLAFLHDEDICHRDMKPSNILVTNTGDLFTFKLTDFGESRSPDIQTKSVPHEYTEHVRRGTRLFSSPEQLMESLKWVDTAAMKRIDVWSCGMVIFCLLSPNTLPWAMELKNQLNKDKVLKESIAAKQLPKGSDKYERLAEETGLGVIYKRCCDFDPESRPDIDVIQYELNNLTSNRMVAGRSGSPAAGEHGDVGARAMDVPSRQSSIGADGTLVDAADQPWDAAAYGGLRVTGVVGEDGPGRLKSPCRVSAHGDLVWVTERGSHRLVVFQRTTEGGHTAHRYVAEYHVIQFGFTATDTETWISQDNDQLQGVRLERGDVVLTRALPTTGRLTQPRGLAYRESNQTLYVCCKDGVHVVDVAGGGVVATLNTPPEVEGGRPASVSVLQDTILVAYGRPSRRLVLYTRDGAPGRVLPGRWASCGVTHNGEHFVVSDWNRGSLRVVSREGEAITRVRVETRGELKWVWPWCISWPPHHHLLYVTDVRNKLFVVSR